MEKEDNQNNPANEQNQEGVDKEVKSNEALKNENNQKKTQEENEEIKEPTSEEKGLKKKKKMHLNTEATILQKKH